MFDLVLSDPTWSTAVEAWCVRCWRDRKSGDLVVELTWILLKPPLCFLTERITCRGEKSPKNGEWGTYRVLAWVLIFSPYRCGSCASRFDGRRTCSCTSWRCWWSRSPPPRSWDWWRPAGVRVAGSQALNLQGGKWRLRWFPLAWKM